MDRWKIAYYKIDKTKVITETEDIKEATEQFYKALSQSKANPPEGKSESERQLVRNSRYQERRNSVFIKNDAKRKRGWRRWCSGGITAVRRKTNITNTRNTVSQMSAIM
ncbi:hypothetical protein ILUMI_20041 [Ignelater luminosus]|uniref:Uncharacterized protein n=1 Tax=Ignelater luminosus TaxID=2038154 RepID=A0A8K0CLC3_IGNLU|nr:hypothetical protein ILUMI_20041 [Ignelater luminosus]